MVNEKILMRLMRRSGYKLQHIARVLDITPCTLRKKVYGESDFKLREIMCLAELLRMSAAERDVCFFDLKRPDAREGGQPNDERAENSDESRPVPVRQTPGPSSRRL